MCLTPLSSGSVQPSEAVATEAGPVLSAQPNLQPRVSSAGSAAVGTDVWLSRIARWGLGRLRAHSALARPASSSLDPSPSLLAALIASPILAICHPSRRRCTRKRTRNRNRSHNHFRNHPQHRSSPTTIILRTRK
ncbi:hypothetical protein PaG_02417 [Moesziomyces aphidis]|uniref:Uncharacterized protein n=1 Tax=Moesziomyces aphidis TaxID=84754 RepID=W3VPJ3_MOEAP|nr:hypothetical protein PaG_02417 [Moesziomyces aphidis]